MSYNLTPAQKANADLIVQELKNAGITNPFTHAAVLSVVSKESEFNPAASEVSYAHTSNDHIRQIFSKTAKLSEADLNALKADKKKFFDFVYTGVAGNGPGEGYAFRGRGFNQLTGRGNYANIAKLTGIDFVGHPELLAEPGPAAKAAVAYFVDGANTLKKTGKLAQYNATSLNDFKNNTDSLGAIYHINAGSGHTKAQLDADPTGGKAKATSRVDALFAMLGTVTDQATAAVKKNPLTTIVLTTGLIVGIYLLVKALKTK